MLDETLTLALDTLGKNKQALIFTSSRASAEKTAEDISQKTKIFLPELSQQILKAASTPTRQCRRLSHCLKKGIAFHHAGLTQSQKTLIEREFKKGTIKIICCTPTLASGISTPAFRVIMKNLKRYSGRWGMNWIPVLEYHQMTGRAGRPEYESFGEAISIAKTEAGKSEIYERYVCGSPEEIYSKLAVEPVFRTYLLSLIATNITNTKEQIFNFFSKTFWAYQFKDMNKLKFIINKMLDLLEEYEFIKIYDKSKKSDFISALKLDSNLKVSIKATLLGQRVSELYLDPFTADHLINCLKNCHQESVDLTPFSFLQMVSHTLEMFPSLRIKAKEHEQIQEKLVQKYNQLLEPEPTLYDLNYDDFANSIKTALFFESWIDEEDEDFLLEEYAIRPGEIHIKLRIADWLLYSTSELARLLQFQPLLKEINKLRVRVKYGVKEELLPLLKLKHIGRKRARKLYKNKIKNIKDLNNTSLIFLSQLIGQKTAELVKQQLENPEKPVPKGKRVGQLAISKFK